MGYGIERISSCIFLLSSHFPFILKVFSFLVLFENNFLAHFVPNTYENTALIQMRHKSQLHADVWTRINIVMIIIPADSVQFEI